jgi:peptidyl-prolyl cis-trans isomerase B (cyclophilin B)
MLTRSLAALAALLMLSLAGCSDDGKDDNVSGEEPAATESTSESAGDCAYVADGSEPAKEATAPPATPTVSGKVNVTIKTTAGDLKAVLDADKTPCTVNNFVSLAEQNYYDGSECHRLGTVPGFSMLQCGDPTATGMGGPGYTIPDELTGSETYPAGTLAMAKTSAPDSGGSQFFLVFEDTQLSPDYTVFGTMDEASLKVLRAVSAKGTDNSEAQGVGRPKQKVVFENVVVG